MLIFLRVLIDLSGLCFGDILCVNAASSFARLVNRQHYLSGFLPVHTKKDLQHLNHKFHWRVIIVEQRHLPKWRFRQFWLIRRNDYAYFSVILRILTTGCYLIFIHHTALSLHLTFMGALILF